MYNIIYLFIFIIIVKKPSTKTWFRNELLSSETAHHLLAELRSKPKVHDVADMMTGNTEEIREVASLTDEISVEVSSSFLRANRSTRCLWILQFNAWALPTCFGYVFVALCELYNSQIWRRVISLFGCKMCLCAVFEAGAVLLLFVRTI